MGDQAPFSLRIFICNGDPDGLRVVERSNWIGKALVFPRVLFPVIRNREEFQQTGVYLLLGPRTDSDGEMIYIGEGDPVRQRFEDHYAKKDFWTKAVFFVAGTDRLNKAHVQYLEARLVNLAGQAKRMRLENGNKPAEPSLSEADRADMEVFLHNILGILPVIGVQAFEHSSEAAFNSENQLLVCEGRGVKATGHDTPQGFIIKSGSMVASDEVPSLREHFKNVCELRADLLKNGILAVEGNKFRFTQDYTFNSPSLASSVVLGRSANGRTDWKGLDGRTLKEIQQAQAKVRE